MIHPLADDPSDLTITQIEDKIADLSRKYFMTHNPQAQDQIATFIEIYKQELHMKMAQDRLRQQENDDNDLDNLINVS